MNTSDFLCGCLQVDRLERRVNHLGHEYRSDADTSQAKENELMLLQRARRTCARAQTACAADARTAVDGSRLETRLSGARTRAATRHRRSIADLLQLAQAA